MGTLRFFRTTYAVVLDHDRSVGGMSSQLHLDRPGTIPWKCVFQGICRQFVYHKPDANRLPGVEHHFFGVHSKGNRSDVSERLAQPPANILKVFLHVDDLIAGRRLEVILTLCSRATALSRAARTGGLD